jgi:glycosyltransferase involved in cell wall biosynthesis
MHILVLIHEYPPVGGGGGQVAQAICRCLAQRGHHSRILTAHLKDIPDRENEPGVEVIRLPSLRREPFRAGLTAMSAYVARSYLTGLHIARSWKPDLIHAHFAVPAGAPAMWIARQTGIPYVLTAHLGDIPGGVPEKTGRWFRLIYPLTPSIWKSAARVVAVSEYTRRLAELHYPIPIRVIPNGVDLTALNPGEIHVNQVPRLVFAGRMMPQKHPIQVVRVLAGLTDLAWECVLLGDGPMMAQVRSEIERLGLNSRFQLPGWVTPEQVIQQFRNSDILFMPSRSEGLPVVGVQAAALGLAIVAGAKGGFSEIITQGENGYLCDPDDTAAFQICLRGLLADPERLLAARQSARRSARRFDLNVVASAYESVFAEVCQNGLKEQTDNE